MAIGRLSMKVGKAGKAAPHADYIVRAGRYASRLDRGEKLEASGSGNMPAWAKANPSMFWEAADAYERKNGTTYREMEIALPRELNPAQRQELAREFIAQEIGDRHAYQWAIHTPRALDGGEQPHIHLMFSERQVDGIERDPDRYFRRYNAKSPERGGARKGYGPNAGKTLSAEKRAEELKALRGRWEAMCNLHLERAGRPARIDMRSYAARGLERVPERKQQPGRWRAGTARQVMAARECSRAHESARQALGREVPDIGRELGYQRQALAMQRECAGMSSAQLRAEMERRQPGNPAELARQTPVVLAAAKRVGELGEALKAATRERQEAESQEKAWRQAHGFRAALHDRGLLSSKLTELGEQQESAQQRQLRLVPELDAARLELEARTAEQVARIQEEQAPARALMAELASMHQARHQQEQEKRLFLEDLAQRYAEVVQDWQGMPKPQPEPPKPAAKAEPFNALMGRGGLFASPGLAQFAQVALEREAKEAAERRAKAEEAAKLEAERQARAEEAARIEAERRAAEEQARREAEEERQAWEREQEAERLRLEAEAQELYDRLLREAEEEQQAPPPDDDEDDYDFSP